MVEVGDVRKESGLVRTWPRNSAISDAQTHRFGLRYKRVCLSNAGIKSTPETRGPLGIQSRV